MCQRKRAACGRDSRVGDRRRVRGDPLPSWPVIVLSDMVADPFERARLGPAGRPAGPAAYFCCGSYQLSRPFWSCLAAASSRRLGAVDHVGRGAPRSRSRGSACRATGSGRSSGSSTCTSRARRRIPAPAGPRSSPAPWTSGEEARQRVGVELGELGRADPLAGRSWPPRRSSAAAFRPMRDVDVVGDVARVAGLLHRRREGAHLELRLRAERRDLPASRPDRSRRGRG